jgi:electron transport complex protein RnfA
MIKLILSIAVSALFINNLIFIKFFGIESFLGLSKKPGIIFGIGITVTTLLTASSFLTFLVYKFILVQLNIDFLKTPVYTIIITFIILILVIAIKKSDSALYKYFGRYLPIIISNSLILGICLMNIKLNYGMLSSALNGIFSGISYMLGLFVISSIREKLELSDIPVPFKGIPIALITAGMISMIILGFDSGFLEFLK